MLVNMVNMLRFIMISGHTAYSDQSSQLHARRARMAHPRVFRHHHAHQIARLGIVACCIFVQNIYPKIFCFSIYRSQKLLSRG